MLGEVTWFGRAAGGSFFFLDSSNYVVFFLKSDSQCCFGKKQVPQVVDFDGFCGIQQFGKVSPTNS